MPGQQRGVAGEGRRGRLAVDGRPPRPLDEGREPVHHVSRAARRGPTPRTASTGRGHHPGAGGQRRPGPGQGAFEGFQGPARRRRAPSPPVGGIRAHGAQGRQRRHVGRREGLRKSGGGEGIGLEERDDVRDPVAVEVEHLQLEGHEHVGGAPPRS